MNDRDAQAVAACGHAEVYLYLFVRLRNCRTHRHVCMVMWVLVSSCLW